MSLHPEDYGATGDVGVSGTSGSDSTAGIQACIDAAVRPQSEFIITDSVLTSAMRSHVLAHTPFLKTVRFAPGGYYRITDTINVASIWNGIIDGNGSYILWDCADATKQMFRLQDCRNLRLMNFRLIAHQDRPTMAGVTMENIQPASGSNVTPFHNFYENIHMYGNAGGFRYGFRAMMGSGGDNNNEMHDYVHCSVFDYVETAYSIEHSQSKHHRFYGCTFNAGSTGKRGVSLRTPAVAPNGNGSFAWWGGGGGSNKVADFQLAGPLENVLIQYAEIEQSRRFLITPFDEVIGGLLAAVPSPASLTMSTPAGSAYVIGVEVATSGFSYTYPANKDTYDLLKSDGTVEHTSIANGALPYNFSGNTTWLQRVVTNGSAIVAVENIGGSFISPSTIPTPTTVIGCRWSSDKQTLDGDFIAYLQKGPLTLIGNRFYNKVRHAKVRVFAGTTADSTVGKVTAIGNVFRSDLAAPYPQGPSRMILDRGDGSYGTPGVNVGVDRSVWIGNSNNPSGGATLDFAMENVIPIP
jgi:hypothetical protein